MRFFYLLHPCRGLFAQLRLEVLPKGQSLRKVAFCYTALYHAFRFHAVSGHDFRREVSPWLLCLRYRLEQASFFLYDLLWGACGNSCLESGHSVFPHIGEIHLVFRHAVNHAVLIALRPELLHGLPESLL